MSPPAAVGATAMKPSAPRAMPGMTAAVPPVVAYAHALRYEGNLVRYTAAGARDAAFPPTPTAARAVIRAACEKSSTTMQPSHGGGSAAGSPQPQPATTRVTSTDLIADILDQDQESNIHTPDQVREDRISVRPRRERFTMRADEFPSIAGERMGSSGDG
jgi:hypothetical protein